MQRRRLSMIFAVGVLWLCVPAHAAEAVIFVDPEMGVWENLTTAPRIAYEKRELASAGHNVTVLQATSENILNALTQVDNRPTVLSYFGHGGPGKATFGPFDTVSLRNRVRLTLQQRYADQGMGKDEAYAKAVAGAKNLGLTEVRNYSCDSLRDRKLAHLMVQDGGDYYGVPHKVTMCPSPLNLLHTVDFFLDRYTVKSLDSIIAQMKALTHSDPRVQARQRADIAVAAVSERVENINSPEGIFKDNMGILLDAFGFETDFLARVRMVREGKRVYGREMAELVWQVAVGGCNDHAELMSYLLTEVGISAPIVYNHSRPNGHAFTVVASSESFDPDNPWTWGEGSFIPDSWAGETFDVTEDIWSSDLFFKWGQWHLHQGKRGRTSREELGRLADLSKKQALNQGQCKLYRESWPDWTLVPPSHRTTGPRGNGGIPAEWPHPDLVCGLERIIFMSRGGYLMGASLDGQEKTRLNVKGDVVHFAVSPNGQKLLYVTRRKTLSESGVHGVDFLLWISDIDGLNPVFVAEVGGREIRSVSLAVDPKSRLVSEDGGPGYPHWAPDSSRVLYTTPPNDSDQVQYYIATVNGNSVSSALFMSSPPPTLIYDNRTSVQQQMHPAPFSQFLAQQGPLSDHYARGDQRLLMVVNYFSNLRFFPTGDAITWSYGMDSANARIWVRLLGALDPSATDQVLTNGWTYSYSSELLWSPQGTFMATINPYQVEGQGVGHQLFLWRGTTGESWELLRDPPHHKKSVLRLLSWAPSDQVLALYYSSDELPHSIRLINVNDLADPGMPLLKQTVLPGQLDNRQDKFVAGFSSNSAELFFLRHEVQNKLVVKTHIEAVAVPQALPPLADGQQKAPHPGTTRRVLTHPDSIRAMQVFRQTAAAN